jgi:hypothetical protein
MSIPFATLKAQNVMKRIGFERYFIYPTSIGIAVNYKPRGALVDIGGFESAF